MLNFLLFVIVLSLCKGHPRSQKYTLKYLGVKGHAVYYLLSNGVYVCVREGENNEGTFLTNW